jgi:hypothetical protein
MLLSIKQKKKLDSKIFFSCANPTFAEDLFLKNLTKEEKSLFIGTLKLYGYRVSKHTIGFEINIRTTVKKIF